MAASDEAAATQPSVPRGLAAVVVNYRSADHVLGCVESLLNDGVTDIVVVDNDSRDDCAARLSQSYPTLPCLAMDRNRGYGAAANRGAARVGGEAILICNPDLVVSPGAAAAMVAALAADPAVGAVGPRINRPDGSRYPSARSFPSVIDAAGHGFIGLLTTDNPFSRRYLREDVDRAGPADWVSGACVAVRRSAFAQVGGFDEAYFMFMEDVDLCWRLGRAGWKVAYEPSAVVTHLEGASRASAPYRMILAHHQSLWRYSWRTTPRGHRAWLPVIAVGLAVRTGLLCARQTLRRGRPPADVLEG